MRGAHPFGGGRLLSCFGIHVANPIVTPSYMGYVSENARGNQGLGDVAKNVTLQLLFR